MRGLVLAFVCLAAAVAAGCGKVHSFTDGGIDSGARVDASAGCNMQACSATADGCCPGACNAGNDPDCTATCGNSVIEPGETCDPLASCPTACPAIGCQQRTLDKPGTCAAACVNSGMITACSATADGCCPSGCNANNDQDCAAVCDNGILEPGEQCDPLASCPTACPQLGCQLYQLFDAGTCRAQCVASTTQTMCINGDGCCPSACNANNDSDCAPACDNGVLESGETCDPLASCPTACPQLGCQLYTLSNPGTCQAACTPSDTQTACVNGDNCCPAGCNANNDDDCQPGCGNGIVEAGETCDPLNTCPTSCPQQGCQLYTLSNPGTCQAACTASSTQTACVNGDGCCPSGCNANTDSDCAPSCGNGVIEPGETCDPPGSCQCPAEAFTCYTTTGSAANCNLQCHVPVTTCGTSGDTCCPLELSGGSLTGGCSAGSDKECTGGGWRPVQVTTVDLSAGNCVTVAVYGISKGGAYDFTSCVPAGTSPPAGDPYVMSISDGVSTLAVSNDDCTDQTALPQLAGWDCRSSTTGQLRQYCASPSPGGFIYSGTGTHLNVTVCPISGAGTKTVPFWVWFNAPAAPHLG